MLSIGKLGVGQVSYYERSVASGAEDYYTGRGEEQGIYLGHGTSQIGLAGVLAHGDLSALVRGRHPAGGRWHDRQIQRKTKRRFLALPNGLMIERPPPQPTAAWDLTFSAPKSVSVLWALSDGPVAADVKAAHVEAVRQAFDHMERIACITRRGKGGSIHLRGAGFVAAGFNHRVSRAGDPQLHTHVIVANATRTATTVDGETVHTYGALHGTLLYREAKTCGYLYQAVLRDELTRRLGVEWTPIINGVAEIAGVARELCETFSKRAGEIAGQLALTGQSGARAANVAALETRARKDYNIDAPSLKAGWLDEAAQIDAPDWLDAINHSLDQIPAPPTSDEELRHLADALLAPEGLTHYQTTFARRDILRAIAEAAPAGASVARIEQLADRLLDLSDQQIQPLMSPNDVQPDTPSLRADQTPLDDYRDTRLYTTHELLDAERSIVNAMTRRAADGTAVVPADRVATSLDARPADKRLAREQRSMVETLTTSGAGMEVVVGLGGSGKTFSVQAAHEIWHSQRIVVRGTALADVAARNLQDETGVPSRTIATLKLWTDPTPGSGYAAQPEKAFPPGGVLIVDEAGMVSTRDLAYLTRGCEQANTKLVLIGDHHQLPEIEAGGTFGGLVHRFEPEGRVERLERNLRQANPWERDALAQLRAGELDHAISAYIENDRIITDHDPSDLRERLVNDWLQARAEHPDVTMIAYTNRDVTTLNTYARTLLDQQGQLGSERQTFAGREWAVGDQIICLKNLHALGLSNGTRGHITHIFPHGLTMQQTNGDRLELPRDYIEGGGATYGYAATGHKTQGKTIRGASFVLVTEHVRREWLYVAMSRATDTSRIYIDTIEHDPNTGRRLTPTERYHAAIIDLHNLANRTDTQRMATDHPEANHLTPRDEQRLADRDLPPAERDRADTERTHEDVALRDELIENPPGYLLPAIGPVPLDPDQRQTWARDAVRLETYRRQHGLTSADMNHQRTTDILGPPDHTRRHDMPR